MKWSRTLHSNPNSFCPSFFLFFFFYMPSKHYLYGGKWNKISDYSRSLVTGVISPECLLEDFERWPLQCHSSGSAFRIVYCTSRCLNHFQRAGCSRVLTFQSNVAHPLPYIFFFFSWHIRGPLALLKWQKVFSSICQAEIRLGLN